ncbi:unnamed protein product [Phytophthora fragariaefolia]|uniref:Unnamed protein product n=1 Tax=Phytophthora fragariaefolia TaxID=1490495 RepID=A0A9W7CWW7_9STRA|nr:unnamed protein product [Phytophthora fragariaefolia]
MGSSNKPTGPVGIVAGHFLEGPLEGGAPASSIDLVDKSLIQSVAIQAMFRYSGNQSLKARAKPSFKSPSDFKTAVEYHLKWCSCEPTPFVSLFASKDHAETWARQLLDHGYRDVVVLEIDSGRLGPLFRVRELVELRGVHTTLPEHLYEDEFLVLRKISKRSVVGGAGVLQANVNGKYDPAYESSDTDGEEGVASRSKTHLS